MIKYTPKEIAYTIHEEVKNILQEKKNCNLMLTGGKISRKIYLEWSKIDDFATLNGINFYFGDERCVKKDSNRSNYHLVMKYLFNNYSVKRNRIFRIFTGKLCFRRAAKQYEKLLPEKIDLLLLSMGEDGHIASIFSNSKVFKSNNLVETVQSVKIPQNRITITPKYLKHIKRVFVFAHGENKIKLYNYINNNKNILSSNNFPAKIVIDKTWFFC